jgi:hypothetical protein
MYLAILIIISLLKVTYMNVLFRVLFSLIAISSTCLATQLEDDPSKAVSAVRANEGSTDESKVDFGMRLPQEVFNQSLAELDPRSFNRCKLVCKQWGSVVAQAQHLVLPDNSQEREQLLANRSLLQLFPRAMNTRNGIQWLVEWTGFYPSHWRSLFATAKFEAHRVIYERLLHCAIPVLVSNSREQPFDLQRESCAKALSVAPYFSLFHATDQNLERRDYLGLLTQVGVQALREEDNWQDLRDECSVVQRYVHTQMELNPSIFGVFVRSLRFCPDKYHHYLPAFAHCLRTICSDAATTDEMRKEAISEMGLKLFDWEKAKPGQFHPIVLTQVVDQITSSWVDFIDRAPELGQKKMHTQSVLGLISFFKNYFDLNPNLRPFAESVISQEDAFFAALVMNYRKNPRMWFKLREKPVTATVAPSPAAQDDSESAG